MRVCADPQHYCIKRLQGNVLTVIAGQPDEAGYVDGHCNTVARFSDPCGVCAGPDGTLYVADTGNHAVRINEFIFEMSDFAIFLVPLIGVSS